MALFRRTTLWQEPVARTGFYASAASYGAFWLADALRPGFVSRYLSVHLFLLAAIGFGAWWGRVAVEPERARGLRLLASAVLGALALPVAWRLGEGLSEFRLLFSAGAFLLPYLCLTLIATRSYD